MVINPPKVNRFGWNVEQCRHIVGSWPWQILGAIRAVVTVWKQPNFFVRLITHDFTDFPSDKFYDISTQQRRSMRRWKLSKQHFEKFSVRGRCSKNDKNCLQNFQVLRFQAAITPQSLQIAGYSLPNWPSTGCLVFILPLESIQSLSHGLYALRSVQETYLPKFSLACDVRYCVLKPIVGLFAGAAWRPIYGRKAD